MKIFKKLTVALSLFVLMSFTGINNQKASADAGLTLGIIGTALGGASLVGHALHWFAGIGGEHVDSCDGGCANAVMYPMAPQPMQMMQAQQCMMPSCGPMYPSMVPPMQMAAPMQAPAPAPYGPGGPVVVNVYGVGVAGGGAYPGMMPPIVPPSPAQYFENAANGIPVRGLW